MERFLPHRLGLTMLILEALDLIPLVRTAKSLAKALFLLGIHLLATRDALL